MRKLLCWLAYHLWMRIPCQWNDTRLAMWLLPYAGECAFAPGDEWRVETEEEMRRRCRAEGEIALDRLMRDEEADDSSRPIRSPRPSRRRVILKDPNKYVKPKGGSLAE